MMNRNCFLSLLVVFVFGCPQPPNEPQPSSLSRSPRTPVVDAGAGDGSSDGHASDAGSNDGSVEGTAITDSGSSDGGSDGDATDAGTGLNNDEFDGGSTDGAPIYPTEYEGSLFTLRGPHKVAAVLLTFANYSESVGSVAQTRAKVFTNTYNNNNPSSANQFFKDASYQRFSFEGHLNPAEGDVFGPVAFAFDVDEENCDYEMWAAEAETALGQEFEAANYDYVFYYFSGPCKSRGRPMWSPRSAMIDNLSIRASGHEGGHALGWGHSSGLGCTNEAGQAVTLSENCTIVEYGDTFGVMGGETRDLPNLHKRGQLGWLEPSNTHTITSDGSFSIAYAEESTLGVQVLRIPRMVNEMRIEQFLYLEVHDNLPATNEGVMLRLGAGYDRPGRSFLLDTHPDLDIGEFSNDTFDNAPLNVGETFTDTLTGISVTLESLDTHGANLSVGAGAPLLCERRAPTGSFVPEPLFGPAGEGQNMGYRITNNDVNCPIKVLIGTFELPEGWTTQPSGAQLDLSLQPGQETTGGGDLVIIPPVGTPANSYDIKINLMGPDLEAPVDITGVFEVRDTAAMDGGVSGVCQGCTVPGQGTDEGCYEVDNLSQCAVESVPRGIYLLLPWSSLAPDDTDVVLANDHISGITSRIYWKDIEINDDDYDWSILDEHFELAAVAGKGIRLAIGSGVYSPGWLIGDRAGDTTCGPDAGTDAGTDTDTDTVSESDFGVQTLCAEVPNGVYSQEDSNRYFPVPWDPTFYGRWQQFLDKLVVHLEEPISSDIDSKTRMSILDWIAVTGPGGHNGEVSHPDPSPDWDELGLSYPGVDGGVIDSSSKLLVALTETWTRALDDFDTHFGSRQVHYTLSFVFNSFPLNGGNQAEDKIFKEALLSYKEDLGNSEYFGLQSNGLDDDYLWSVDAGWPDAGWPRAKDHWKLVRNHDVGGATFTGMQTRGMLRLYPDAADKTSCGRKNVWTRLNTNIQCLQVDVVEIYRADAERTDCDGGVRNELERLHEWLTDE